jgi:hypothetical protein
LPARNNSRAITFGLKKDGWVVPSPVDKMFLSTDKTLLSADGQVLRADKLFLPAIAKNLLAGQNIFSVV